MNSIHIFPNVQIMMIKSFANMWHWLQEQKFPQVKYIELCLMPGQKIDQTLIKTLL